MKGSSAIACIDGQDFLIGTPSGNGNGALCAGAPRRLNSMDLERYRARVLNSYALVAYLPEPLGSFFDNLSKELVPGCKPRSHITLLPPRHLSGTLQEAQATLRKVTADLEPFELEITSIEIFDVTSVVYADIGQGRNHLLDIHRRLNVNALHFTEQFAFHPHITLAIDATADDIPDLVEHAREEWAAYPHPRRFLVDNLHLVHNVALGNWEDVSMYPLSALAHVRSR